MEKQYEGCFLLKADLPKEETAKEVALIEENITKNGARIAKKEFWGTKRLAYPIKKKTDAVYHLFYFKASPEMLPHIEQSFRRRENILRYLFLQRKRLPEEGKSEKPESYPAKKKGREE